MHKIGLKEFGNQNIKANYGWALHPPLLKLGLLLEAHYKET